MAENIIENLERISKEIKEVKTELDKATGRYEASMAALSTLGYKTIEEAEEAVKSRTEQITVRQDRLNADYEAFYKKYEEVFSDE